LRKLFLLTLLATAALLAAPATAEGPAPVAMDAPHPFSIHDMVAMQRLGDPQVSPEGDRVVFTVRSTDLEADRGRTDLWLLDLDEKDAQPRRLTADPAADWNPRWSPCGMVYFLSTRSGSAQVWTIDPDGGEAAPVTDLPLDVDGLEFVPQLKSLALVMHVFPGLSPAETAARDAEIAASPRTGRIYDELMFRHWDTWEDGKRAHPFLLPVQAPRAEPVDLLPDLDADVPTRPWGGTEEWSFTADGRELVFTAKILPGSEPAWSTDYDIYAVATDGGGALRCLTEANTAWDTEPVFSPDGRTLAYIAMAVPAYEADRYRIVLRDWAGGETRVLTEDWDRSPHGLVWSADGKTLYCIAGNLGQRSIFAVRLKDGRVTELVHDGSNGSLRLAGRQLLYLKNHLRSPNEIYAYKFKGKSERRLTGFNDARLALARMGEPEQFTFAGWNGETVHAYLVKPYDWSAEAAAAGRTWPVVFLVHGGPQGSFGNDFHYRWNPQAYVGAGFATVAVDFHGSTGYGQEFCDSIGGHWGDRPLEDLEKGLDSALERYRWLDGERVVAAGASYGAFMINWMHGQPFGKRFKAFVSHDGNLDERMAYFDTEELWFPEREHGGTPWQSDGYVEFNPIDHVANWHVPTLIVHGALDYRVVETQGLSAFTALRRLGVPAKLLYYPDENHWVLKPNNSIQWHEEVMDWLTRWIE